MAEEKVLRACDYAMPFAKVAGLLVLALVGGAGMAYAPVPTFVVAAFVFVAGLWLILGRGRRAPRGPGTDVTGPRSAALGRSEAPALGALVGGLAPLFLLCWWVAMVAPLARYTPLEVGENAVAATASGSLQNQVLVASFGLVGTLFLPAALRRVGKGFWWLMGLWGVYLLWGYASLFWSAAPAITVRNLVAFVLVSLGSFGFGAGFYGARSDGARLFFRHVVVAGFVSAGAILLPLPFHLGMFNPLDPTQRLEIAGNFTAFASRPVMLAVLVLVMTSLVGLRAWRTRDWLGVVVLLLPVFVLKTRGPLLWMILALAVVYLLHEKGPRDRIFQAGLALVAVFGTYLLYAEGVLAQFVPFLTRGNAELSLTLTGRLPLWDALMPLVREQPFLGAGFAAFWNPDNLYMMERLVGFPVVSSHNGFVEELLSTGAVGLALFLAFWVSAMAVSLKRAARGDAIGWMAFLFLIFYLFLNLTVSLMQEYLELPFMVVFALLGLMAVRSEREGPAVGGAEERGEPRPSVTPLRPTGKLAVKGRTVQSNSEVQR